MKKLKMDYIPPHLYAIFAGIVVFWVYVQTLAPTVSFFDSGELIAAAYTLGVAHPPGYPLYVLLGWIFSQLPFGMGAYRLNVMSAWFGMLAAVVVFALTYLLASLQRAEISRDVSGKTPAPEQMLLPVVALVAALTFAFSPTHWNQAVIAEVYSLNAFLCGLIMLLLLRWRREVVEKREPTPGPSQEGIQEGPTPGPSQEGSGVPKAWLLYLVAFLFGIGFGNHQTISLFALAACFVVVVTIPRILFKAKTVILILVWLALGSSIYALVPIRAAQNPPINWGNPSTWRQFKWLVTREGYDNVPRGGAISSLWNDLRYKAVTEKEILPGQSPFPDRQVHGLTRIAYIFQHSLFFRQLRTFHPWQEFSHIGMILAIVGVVYGLIFARIPTLTVLIAICFFVLLTIFVSDPPEENIFLVEEFHTPAYLLTAVLIGFGLMGIARGMLWVVHPWKPVQYVLVFLLTLNFLILPGSQLLRNVSQIDRSRNYVAYDYASNVLSSLQPNAILFTWGDSGAFPLWYLQIVEKQRQDVILIHVPHLSSPWYVASLPQDVLHAMDRDENQAGSSLDVVNEIIRTQISSRPVYFDFSSAHTLPLPYELLPHGITYKVAIPGDTLREDIWNRYRFRGILDHTRIAMDEDIRRTFSMYGSARAELGQYYLESEQLEKAAEHFNAAVQFDPELGEHIVHHLHFRNKLASEHPVLSP